MPRFLLLRRFLFFFLSASSGGCFFRPCAAFPKDYRAPMLARLPSRRRATIHRTPVLIDRSNENPLWTLPSLRQGDALSATSVLNPPAGRRYFSDNLQPTIWGRTRFLRNKRVSSLNRSTFFTGVHARPLSLSVPGLQLSAAKSYVNPADPDLRRAHDVSSISGGARLSSFLLRRVYAPPQ